MRSLDGDIGKTKDFYFDGKFWTIRYLVADTGNWLTGRQVLISPYALTGVDRAGQTIAVNLTKEKIKNSPSPDTDKPVSRQFENSYYGYYEWPGYWGGAYSWVGYPYISHEADNSRNWAPGGKEFDPHLRSIRQVTGYHVKASDGAIGHVEAFIIDDKTWAIRYLIIDTKSWLPWKRVIISPKWIQSISSHDSSVFVDVPRETIKQAPEYLCESSLTRDYESLLHSHYNRQGYWVDEPVADFLVI